MKTNVVPVCRPAIGQSLSAEARTAEPKLSDMTAFTPRTLSPQQTADALPYAALTLEIERLLQDPSVHVPARLVQPLQGGGSLFVMPAADARVAMTKLITFIAHNAQQGLPTIQGDIVVFDVATGQRVALMDGPTVTARRTAAVSLLAAQKLAPRKEGPLLIVGAGVQGLSHLEAFHEGLGVKEVWIASRSVASADALVGHAERLGMKARRVDDPNAALAECPLVITTTPAKQVVMTARPRDDAFVSAVGAFTPRMVEWSADVCQHVARTGMLVVDTRDADHEAGDFLQAGLDVAAWPTLSDVVCQTSMWQAAAQRDAARTGPVFFKSCGWGGWDLAAARCVAAHRPS
jgi:1-piperideine-2-carboxylate/1-pyrroline-2-carboxylate reductase [NAD(P)H]